MLAKGHVSCFLSAVCLLVHSTYFKVIRLDFSEIYTSLPTELMPYSCCHSSNLN